MTLTIDSSKQLAAALRQALKAVKDPSTLTHAQCLDLIAQAHQQADWNTLHARLKKTYFYDRLDAYLCSSALVMRSLSVRKATAQDLLDFADNPETPFGKLLAALDRTNFQLQAISSGLLTVDPSLQGAINEAADLTLPELADREYQAYKKFRQLPAWGPEPFTVMQAEQFQLRYLDWRLATLAHALRLSWSRPHESLLRRLVEENVDIHGFCTLLRLDEASATSAIDDRLRKALTRISAHQLKVMASAWFTRFVEGDCGELAVANIYDSHNLDLDLGTVRGELGKLETAFPEIVVWQTLTELKPLLAPAADSFHSRRT